MSVPASQAASQLGGNFPPLNPFAGRSPYLQTDPAVAQEAEETKTPDETPGEAISRVEEKNQAERVRGMIEAAGVDPDQGIGLLQTLGHLSAEEQLAFLQTPEGEGLMSGMATVPQFALQITDYQAALMEAGFTQAPEHAKVSPKDYLGPTIGPPTAEQAEALEAEGFRGGSFSQYNSKNGWTIYGNGALVGPNGELIFDPSKEAPGSTPWLRSIQTNWTEEQVSQWRKKLVEFGYLDPSAKNSRGFDTVFLQALQNFHANRYIYGNGKGVRASASGDGRFAGQPLFDYNEIDSQVRNSVASQLEQFYGYTPDEEEVRRWSQFVIRQATSLQRRFRSQDVGSYTSAAYTEAEESFVDQIRRDTAPQRQAVEENTTLRDGLRNAAAAAGALG